MAFRSQYNARGVYAIQNAVKLFSIDINFQNPDGYSPDKLNQAVMQRDRELTDGPGERGLFPKNKTKHKYRIPTALYIGVGLYLLYKGHHKTAAALAILYFVDRSGLLERWIDGVSSKMRTTSVQSRSTDRSFNVGQEIGVNFSKFDNVNEEEFF